MNSRQALSFIFQRVARQADRLNTLLAHNPLSRNMRYLWLDDELDRVRLGCSENGEKNIYTFITDVRRSSDKGLLDFARAAELTVAAVLELQEKKERYNCGLGVIEWITRGYLDRKIGMKAAVLHLLPLYRALPYNSFYYSTDDFGRAAAWLPRCLAFAAEKKLQKDKTAPLKASHAELLRHRR